MKSTDNIYLDYNATTPVAQEVLDAMLPYFRVSFGNASSKSHPFGWQADLAVQKSRAQLASLLNCDPSEIYFTSGATESLNIAIKGVFRNYQSKGKHIVTAKSEHPAVLDVCEKLEKEGAEVTFVDVDENGLIDISALEDAIRNDTVLVAIMFVNNETGVIQPVQEIGRICQEKGVFFLSDATQAFGKTTIDLQQWPVDFIAFTAHKVYGPKGVGALYIRGQKPRIKLYTLLDGGSQESGIRSGTLNVPGIVGLGAAAALAEREMKENQRRIAALQAVFEKHLSQIEEVEIAGSRAPRLYNVSNFSFRYVEGNVLMGHFNQKLAVSAGSACSSATMEPSHVLKSMGFSDEKCSNSIRFSFGRDTTENEIMQAISMVKTAVEQLRNLSPKWKLFQEGVDVDALL